MTMMNTMASVFISLIVTTIYVGLAIAQGDPTAKITYQKIDIKVFDNPYADTWVGEIHPSGDKITLKVPLKEDLPATIMVKGRVEFMGSEVGQMVMPLCEAFNDTIIAPSVLAVAIPKGKFPHSCPVKSNGEYMIKEYIFPPEKIPPGLPDGLAVCDVEVYEPGKDPYFTAHLEAQLSHKIPGLGR